MNVTVSPVEEADLPRCSEIFLSAFSDDAIMRIVRPSRLADPSLSHEQRLSRYSASLKRNHLNKETKGFMKAVHVETGRIVGVAVWAKPGHPMKNADKDLKEDAEKDPEEDEEALGRLIKEMNEKREKLMGDQPHWYLTFLVVDPMAQGKGVGKQLLAWGIEQADSSSPPLPCVLEASEVGQPVYVKRNFEIVDQCTLYVKDAQGEKIEGSDYKWPVMLRRAKGSD